MGFLTLYLIVSMIIFALSKIEMDYGPTSMADRIAVSLLWFPLLVIILIRGRPGK